jgi:hypothetical protein
MHSIFAPAELTHSEDLDHHETLEIKERTGTYYLYVSPDEDADGKRFRTQAHSQKTWFCVLHFRPY